MMRSLALWPWAVASLLALAACTNDDDKNPADDFDRGAMLANYADNLMQPGYQALAAELSSLQAAWDTALAQPGSASVQALRQQLLGAWLAWQEVSAFDFGPAIGLRASVNVFPTDTAQVNANIGSGSWNLDLAANTDAKGFPALDYLLNAPTESQLVAQLQAAGSRTAYIAELISNLRSRIADVLAQWQSGYRSTFVNAMGTDVGSSTGQLVNEFVRDFEDMRRFKLGDCIGIRTLGTLNPWLVESYFGAHSLELYRAHSQASLRVFRGESATGANGPGLDDYLNHVGAQGSSGPLASVIEGQYAVAIAAAEAIGQPFHLACSQQTTAMNAVYAQYQALVPLLKADMTSALGILITYQDNDGD